jgi:hypothetical protein
MPFNVTRNQQNLTVRENSKQRDLGGSTANFNVSTLFFIGRYEVLVSYPLRFRLRS